MGESIGRDDASELGDGTALVGVTAGRSVEVAHPTSAAAASTHHAVRLASEWSVIVRTTVTCAG